MLGTGAVGIGMEAEGEEEFMGADEELDMGAEDELEGLEDEGLGDPGLDMDLGDAGGEGESDLKEVDLTVLRSLLDEVERGELTADEAYDQCCGDAEGGDLGGLADELDGMPSSSSPPRSSGGGEELAGLDDDDMDMGRGKFSECMESVQRIANMLTEDPDIFSR